MANLTPQEVIDIVLGVVESTYGNLGFLSFRLHSIKKNSKETIYIIKYSFIPRSKEEQRIFYEAKVNVEDKNVFEIHEIKETDLSKESKEEK